MKKHADLDKENDVGEKLKSAIISEKTARNLLGTIDALVNWLHHDVLEKAGLPLQEREQLYDFVVREIKKIESI